MNPQYSLFIEEPGKDTGRRSVPSGWKLTTRLRRVEIHNAANRSVMDFVTVNKNLPTSRYPEEVALARKVLALLNPLTLHPGTK